MSHLLSEVDMSRVIRVDEEVYYELRRRARPFEDTPNSVLRQELGLEERVTQSKRTCEGTIDPAIVTLLSRAGVASQQATSTSKRANFYRVRGASGNVVAHIERQKSRLRISAPKGATQRLGLTHWDRELRGGYYTADDEVYWYVADSDDDAIARGASALRALCST